MLAYTSLYWNVKLIFIAHKTELQPTQRPAAGLLSLKTFFAMDKYDKTNEELIIELNELHLENNSLLTLKKKQDVEFKIANNELLFQNKEKKKRAAELIIADRELLYQNEEKMKRASELVIANIELLFESEEKKKRAAELIIANIELLFENEEKEKRAAELIIANRELLFENEEKEKRAAELVITNKELQQLIQLNNDKDKFLSIIAHDLKSPFTSIIGYVELLIEQINEKNDEEISEFANIILQSSNRALKLLTNLMVWTQSQSGRMNFHPENFDIIKLINEVILLLNDIAQQKSILIACSLPPSIQINGDRDMISTILRNLITNAIKYTQPEGKITISVMEKLNELVVSVSDTGVGIPKDKIGNLFNIKEIHSTKGTNEEVGTGLGLILCKEFIEKNNGKIWVDSKAGIGSTFYFSMPLRREYNESIEMIEN